jgi:hypothetical protein
VYKINTQKSEAFPYKNNKQYEKEIRKTIPFTTASRTGGVAQAVKVPALQTRSSEFKPQSQ